MEPLPKIPSPASLKWREFRYNFMPAAVFLVVCVFAVVLWKDRVAIPQMVGEVELLASTAVTGENGMIVELKVDRFSRVSKGDPIAEIRTSDPDSIRVRLDAITADLRVLQTRLSQDQQRILQSYEQLRLNLYEERVALATAKVELDLANSELRRSTKLFEDKIMSQTLYDEAVAIAKSREAEVSERTLLVEEITRGLENLSPDGANEFNTSVGRAIEAAIAAEEKKLKQARKSVTIRAPIGGIITEVFHQPGERVLEGDEIATVVSTTPRHIIGYVRQPVNIDPQPGDAVEVRSRSDRNKVGIAKVLKVGEAIEPISKRLVIQESIGSRAGLPLLVSVPEDIGLIPGEVVDLALVGQ